MLDADKQLDLEVEGERVHLTSLDRELWPKSKGHPAVTKRDLLAYYLQIGHIMLPHLHDRPLAFVRYPDGMGGERFFQKHWEKGRPDYIETANIWTEVKSARQDWLLCNNLPSLLWFAQMSSLEIHAWYSRITPQPGLPSDFSTEGALEASVLSYPDFMVFDLDPNLEDTETTFNPAAYKRTKVVAQIVREVLDEHHLQSFLKTSGKTGLHLFVPIRREYDYARVKDWAKRIGKEAEKRCPEDTTMVWSLQKRPKKIFIDHNQNVRGKTLVAAYSTRPSPEATVSMPIEWDDLDTVDPREFTIFTVPKHLERTGDPWDRILMRPQTLTVLGKASLI